MSLGFGLQAQQNIWRYHFNLWEIKIGIFLVIYFSIKTDTWLIGHINWKWK